MLDLDHIYSKSEYPQMRRNLSDWFGYVGVSWIHNESRLYK